VPTVVRDVKFGANDPGTARTVPADFELKPQVAELFAYVRGVDAGEIRTLEVKNGCRTRWKSKRREGAAMVEATFEQAYPFAARARKCAATAAVVSGAIPARTWRTLSRRANRLLACSHLNSIPLGISRTFVERVVASQLPFGARRPACAGASLPGRSLRVLADGGTDRKMLSSTSSGSLGVDGLDRQLIFLLLNYSPAEAGRILGLPRFHGPRPNSADEAQLCPRWLFAHRRLPVSAQPVAKRLCNRTGPLWLVTLQ